MTDQLASFSLLSQVNESKVRRDAVETFYQQWQSQDLVLDKWFAVQASCGLAGTLERVKVLLSHRFTFYLFSSFIK